MPVHEYSPAIIEKICPIPKIAIPTIVLTLLGLFFEFSIMYLLYHNIIHKYIACTINTIVIYALFTPMHDASHGSIGRQEYRWINNIIGHLSSFAFPVPFPAFRYIHLQHHKYTNNIDYDVDTWTSHGPWYILPFKWFTLELYYYYVYISNIGNRPKNECYPTIGLLVFWIFFFHYFISIGYGEIMIWSWLLPGRLATGILGFFFDYLPHRPHSHTNEEDIYKATCVISLYEQQTMILTWPLLQQNYHNIHHLVPYIPFYCYAKVWHAIKKELIEKGTEIIPLVGSSKNMNSHKNK